MDFAEIYSDTRTVVWTLANGAASINVTLRSGNCDEVRAIDRMERTAVQEAMRKGRSITPQEEDAFAVKKLAALIASWEWPKGSTFAGREPDNSDEFKVFVLSHPNPVAQEILKRLGEEVADLQGFLKR